MEQLLKALKEDKELSAKLKKMWQEKSSAADIVAVLKKEGHDVDISAVEDALQKAQNELAENVAMEKLDDEALAAVAGGGDGDCTNTSDCDNRFKLCTTGATTSRCTYNYDCDEHYQDICRMTYSCVFTGMVN